MVHRSKDMKNGDYLSIPMTRTDWVEILQSIQPIRGRHQGPLDELAVRIHQRLREPRNPADTRYRLMSDNDSHKYLVPVSYENHFEKILLDEGDPGEYYTRVEGGLTFTDPLEL